MPDELLFLSFYTHGLMSRRCPLTLFDLQCSIKTCNCQTVPFFAYLLHSLPYFNRSPPPNLILIFFNAPGSFLANRSSGDLLHQGRILADTDSLPRCKTCLATHTKSCQKCGRAIDRSTFLSSLWISCLSLSVCRRGFLFPFVSCSDVGEPRHLLKTWRCYCLLSTSRSQSLENVLKPFNMLSCGLFSSVSAQDI